MGHEAGNSDDDRKHVFPLMQKQIEKLKHRVESDLFDSLSPSVGSGWKLRWGKMTGVHNAVCGKFIRILSWQSEILQMLFLFIQ